MPLRGIFKYSILDAKGDAWRRQRHLLTPSFTTGKLKDVNKYISIFTKFTLLYLQNVTLFCDK